MRGLGARGNVWPVITFREEYSVVIRRGGVKMKSIGRARKPVNVRENIVKSVIVA